MANDTVTLFLSPTKTVLAWAKTRVDTLADPSTVDLAANPHGTYVLAQPAEIFENQTEQELFVWITKATRNQAAIRFVNSKYNRDGTARRNLMFDVYGVYRHTTNRIAAQAKATDILDAIIGVLDHETLAGTDFMCYVAADAVVDFPNSALSVYMASFVVEDY